MTRTSDFDYALPAAAIAQQAPARRDRCRLAVVDRASGGVSHIRFDQIGAQLRAGDLLVVNDSKVFPARVPCHRDSGGSAEVFLTEAVDGAALRALIKPGGRLRDGEAIIPDRDPKAGRLKVLSRDANGVFSLAWEGKAAWSDRLLARLGVTPLPPYITRDKVPAPAQARRDQRAYQTVFAAQRGSVAAPTAGLHFSQALLRRLREQGIGQATVTLHVGAGTFLPVKTENLEEHPMHAEIYRVPMATQAAMAKTRRDGGRVIAVGTTALRALESSAREKGGPSEAWRSTQLFLKPGDPFLAVGGLLTNFHQPKSTLLPLICAFWNRQKVLELYRDCLARNYRFLSYGDACLFL